MADVQVDSGAMNEFRAGLEGDRRIPRRRSPNPIAKAARCGTAASTSRSSSAAFPSSRSGGCSSTTRSPRASSRPSPTPSPGATGKPVADLQAATARLGAEWGLKKLIDISDEQAKERSASPVVDDDLDRRAVAPASHDGDAAPVDAATVAAGETAAERFLLEWRGEADPKHVKAIDTYWICTAEHGMNASTFTARVVASTGADCAACLSSAVGALSGPLHGGAPARVLPMLDAAAEAASIDEYVTGLLDRKERLMGFGHRVYRAEDPRARVLRRTAKELDSPRFEVAEELERAALAELAERHPERVLATNVEFWSAVVLDVAEIPPADDAGDVRLLADGRLVGSHPRAEAHRTPRPALGRVRGPAGERPSTSVS